MAASEGAAGPPRHGASELAQRLAVAAVGAPIALAAVWFGGPLFALVVAAVTAITLAEFADMLREMGRRPLVPAGVTATLLLLVGAYRDGEAGWATAAGLAVILLGCIQLLARPAAPGHLEDLAGTALGVLAIAWPAVMAIRLRQGPDGLSWVLLALLGAWASDTGAYLVGRACGRHLLLPHVSPNKTIEGAIGGLCSAVLTAIAVSWISGVLPIIAAAPLGLLIGMATQTGDLFESLLKRQAGVKESGRLLPGHGGLFDRIDGLLWSCAATSYGMVIIRLFQMH